jgi:hypothetical protein
MRIGVLRSFLLVAAATAFMPVGAVAAGPPIDLADLRIKYGYGPAMAGRGFWMGSPTGGEWRVTDGRLGEDPRLTLDVEVRPPAISVPLDAGPAVLFATMELDGGTGGDVGASVRLSRIAAVVLPPCADAADCVYRGSITLDTGVLPGVAARHTDASWGSVSIGLSLVRTFAQGTWLQVLSLYDESRDDAGGTVGDPVPFSSRSLTSGAFPVAQHIPWNDIDRRILARVERLRRSTDDPSGRPVTVPLLVDIRASACTPGWTIATATGDTLVNIREEGTSVPMRVEVPVGAEWIAWVPSLDRVQGTGDPARAFGPHPIDAPTHVGGWVSGDHYLCAGQVGGSLTWRAAGAEEVAGFPGYARCVQPDRSITLGRPGSTGRCLS